VKGAEAMKKNMIGLDHACLVLTCNPPPAAADRAARLRAIHRVRGFAAFSHLVELVDETMPFCSTFCSACNFRSSSLIIFAASSSRSSLKHL